MPTTTSQASTLARWWILSLFLALPAFGQAKVVMPIILRVLTYDRTFDARGTGEFTVAVVSEAAQNGARDKLCEELKSLSVTTIKNRPLKFLPLEITNQKALSTELGKVNADAVLVVPGVSAGGLQTVATVANASKRYTLALDTAMVETELLLGVSTGGGKPQIVINDRTSKSIGAQFDAAVLKLARVVQ